MARLGKSRRPAGAGGLQAPAGGKQGSREGVAGGFNFFRAVSSRGGFKLQTGSDLIGISLGSHWDLICAN